MTYATERLWDCVLAIVEGESVETSDSEWKVQHHNVVANGIDPRLDAQLLDTGVQARAAGRPWSGLLLS